MSCLNPRLIKIDRRSKSTLLYGCESEYRKEWTRYRDVRPSLVDVVQVPCGKCIECMRARQNALISRAIEESTKRGTFIFLTLTYADEYLPIAQSLWRASKSTGEVELVDKGEVIVSGRKKRLRGERAEFQKNAEAIRAVFKDFKASETPRYYDSYIDGFEDDDYVYFSRLTPSVCREDVRLWLKSARVRYERERGCKLSPFTYICVSEYGPNTCRPHYHLAFFGLTPDESAWLSSSWPYGFICQRTVNRVNPDGTDGFAIASAYLGKYMSKGKFDCPSVLDKSAEKPRICQSMHIGETLLEKLRPYMLCFDMFGKYDLDTMFCPALHRRFTDSEVEQLCEEIPKRFVYDVNAKFKLPVPRLFRRKVFYNCHYRDEEISEIVGCETCKVTRKVPVYVPTTLWLLVADHVRSKFSDLFERQLSARLFGKSPSEIFNECSSFASYQECLASNEASFRETRYKEFLCKSVF